MKMKIGDRVGAILGSTGAVTEFLGYGIYAGHEVPPDTGPNSMTGMLAEANATNPKVLLDNGDVVWGCECWWGPEAQIRAQLDRADRVETVRIADKRLSP